MNDDGQGDSKKKEENTAQVKFCSHESLLEPAACLVKYARGPRADHRITSTVDLLRESGGRFTADQGMAPAERPHRVEISRFGPPKSCLWYAVAGP